MLEQERTNNSISWGARGPPEPLGAEVVGTSLLATSAQRAWGDGVRGAKMLWPRGSDNSYFALIIIIILVVTPREVSVWAGLISCA